MIALMSIFPSNPKAMSTGKPLIVIASVLLFACCAGAKAGLSIATTIRPLHFIALAIVGDHGEVSSLIDANSSPHHFNLSPSDRLALAGGDIVVWIGPELESHISDNITDTIDAEKLLTVSTMTGLNYHKIGNDQLDAHLWLDTRNALEIARAITEKAQHLDPAQSDYYLENLNKFKATLEFIEQEIAGTFSDLVDRPFMVYHNGFQYFEKQFGLAHQVDLVADPKVAPTINDILAIRAEIESTTPICLISEPDASAQLIRTFMENYSQKDQLTEVVIDLLGNTVPESPDAYIELINHVAHGFSSCLGAGAALQPTHR